MNGLANAFVGAAAADVSGHGRVDVLIAGIGVTVQQSGRRHDLTGLAVAALGNIFFLPGRLNRMVTGCRNPFNGGNRLTDRARYWEGARPDGRSVQMDGAGTTLTDSTTVFRSG